MIMAQAQPVWSDHADAMLGELRRDGLTYAETARRLSEALKVPVSRGAALSRAYRTGICEFGPKKVDFTGKPKEDAGWQAHRIAKAKEWKPHDSDPEPIACPDARPQLDRKPGECTWMIADGGPAYAWKACCSPVHVRPDLSKSPYCTAHHDIAYATPPEVEF